MLTLEPERLKNRLATTREKHRRWEGSSPRRSSGLRFQFLGVEVFSFLPQSQRNGCNLARQRETRHGGLDAFGQRSLVEILEWSGLHTRPGGGSFEQPFQIMVVILVQAAYRSEEHTSELQSRSDLVCRLLLEKKTEAWDEVGTWTALRWTTC